MGLDTTHDAWHGGYISFNIWRCELAKAAGYQVVDFIPRIDWETITDDNMDGRWNAVPADPLIVLLAHYDCEGIIQPDCAAALADRLDELKSKLQRGEGPGHIRDWQKTTQRFINGLRLAASRGEELEFY